MDFQHRVVSVVISRIGACENYLGVIDIAGIRSKHRTIIPQIADNGVFRLPDPRPLQTPHGL